MQNACRYYEELTKQIITAKNQLHRHLQSTFPQIESIMSNPTGKVYWTLVSLFPHAQYVLDHDFKQIYSEVVSVPGIGKQRASYITAQLMSAAKQAVPYDSSDSITIRAIQRNISQLLNLENERTDTINYLHKLCMQVNASALTIYTSIPGITETTVLRLIAELGDIRRFDNSAQIDAFVGIDTGRYQSGEVDSSLGINKHGNTIARKILYCIIGQMESTKTTGPCHITDYYDRKKQSSHDKGFKKIAIASVHKLIRTMYALVKQNRLYDYNVAIHNQRL